MLKKSTAFYFKCQEKLYEKVIGKGSKIKYNYLNLKAFIYI